MSQKLRRQIFLQTYRAAIGPRADHEKSAGPYPCTGLVYSPPLGLKNWFDDASMYNIDAGRSTMIGHFLYSGKR